MHLALETFAGSNVQTTCGTRVLGLVIGTQETCDKFLDGKSAEQKKLQSKLGDIAKNEFAECACVPYQRGETKTELHYPNNTFLFSLFRNIGSNFQRKHDSGANLKRKTYTKRKGNFLTATQVKRTRHRLPRKPSRLLRTVKEVF